MAFTYGFYNYNENDADQKLYDAIQMSQLFDGIITDGVYGHVGSCFRVTAMGGNLSNTVKIGTGRCWFNHTWSYNDTDYVLENAPGAPNLYDRIDAVVIDINSNKNARINKFKWVVGTESETPVKPTLNHDKYHNQYALCYIHREPGRNEIREVDIENAVGTPETPYVTGVLETLDTEQILSAFQNDFDRLYVALEDLLSSVQTDSSDIIEELEQTKDRCDAIYSDIQTIKSNCSSVLSSIRAIKTEATNTYADIRTVKLNADSTYKTIQNYNNLCRTLYNNIQTIKTNSNNVYSQIQTVKSNSDSLYSQIQSTKTSCDSLYSAIQTTKTNCDNLYAYIRVVKSECEQAESTIATLNSKIAKADADLADIASKMSQADADIASLESKISTLEGDIESELATVKSQLENDLNTYFSQKNTYYQSEFRAIDNRVSQSEATLNTNLNNWFNAREAEYESHFKTIESADEQALSAWMDERETEYEAWFDNLTTDLCDTPISDQQFAAILELLGLEE